MDSKYNDKKIAVFNATLALIANKGFHDSPMSEISNRSGVSVGTIYNNFKSKDYLINQLFNYIDVTISTAITEGYVSDVPIKEQFVYLAKKLIELNISNPEMSEFVVQYIDSPYGLKRRKKALLNKKYPSKQTIMHVFYKIFDGGKEQGQVKELPNFLLFTLVFGCLVNFSRDIRLGLMDYNTELINSVIEVSWDILKR